jgi:UDP-2-acetamido-2,6-beta-L-arabino-hexul-4-ose reductase
MRVAITGAGGFLGWHVRVLSRALGWPEPVRLDRCDLVDPDRVAELLTGVDRVVHLAGVNRGDAGDVASGNVQLATALARGLRRCATPPETVVFANSVQAGNGTPYGDSKAAAADILASATDTGARFVDLRLPQLYGEHGRPDYNSVVATFCRRLAEGAAPEIHEDRELTLAYVGDAAARLLDAPPTGVWDAGLPPLRITVGALADRLSDWAGCYREGTIPPLPDRHAVRLFNTYRSHCFPDHFPLRPPRHGDARGELVEVVRHAGGGQVFWSATAAGHSRGEHFHLAKVERFAVLRGTAEISLRRLGHRDVLCFPVSGADPVVVDMPTMWAHRITNVGPDELITVFWVNELLDAARPDTYPEPVVPAEDPAPLSVDDAALEPA